ncbi:MAG: ATP-binding protein [Myxococcales bacterium]|nr:ATP-binding protein [Myxococcales bacterium]
MAPPAKRPIDVRAGVRARFVGRGAELDALRGVLAAAADGVQVVLVRGEAGIGKSTLLRVFAWDAEDAGHRVAWISGEHVAPNADALTAALARNLGASGTWATLGHGERPDVLVVDAAETLEGALAWLFGEALAAAGGRLLVVLGTRVAPAPSIRALVDLSAARTDVELTALSREDATRALALRGVPASEHVAAVEGCEGSPLAIAMVAEHFARARRLPDLDADAPWLDLARELLRTAESDAEALGLRALCLAHAVDEDLLAAMLPKADARAVYRQLAQRSFVDETSSGLVLHGIVRKSVLTDLRRGHPALHRDLAARCVERLAARAVAPGIGVAASFDTFAECFYVARGSDQSKPYIFAEHMRSHGLRRATDADLAVFGPEVERFEGAAARRTFDDLAPLQRDRVFVVTQNEEPAAIFFAVDLVAAPPSIVDADPVLRAGRDAALPVDDLTLARFWFARGTYQDFGPEMTALMSAGPIVAHHLPPVRYVAMYVAHSRRWAPLRETFGMQKLVDGLAGVGGDDGEIDFADVRALAPGASSQAETTRRVLVLHATNLLAGPPADSPALDAQAFALALREALPDLRRPLDLADSPLLGCALVADHPSPATRLVEVVRSAVEELARSGGYEEEAEAFAAAYLDGREKHAAVAARLGIPFGTLRHRTRRAAARLGELLWQRELAARAGAPVRA